MKIYPYPSQTAEKRLQRIIDRKLGHDRKQLNAVQKILADVRKNGDQALMTYTRQFDAPAMTPERMVVTPEEMAAARSRVDRKFMRALNRAADQIAAFHRKQLPRSWFDTPRPGTFLGQMVHPVDAAGVYVPGGRGGETPLVTSVLMGAIPARIAGVERVVMVTPPNRDGGVSPYLLAAAAKAGVDTVYKAGSAWAIAALAYGTETIGKVDVIVGPGNIYVTLAKKLVTGTVQIDIIAGPSEVLVIADAHADPEHVAADLLSQAEHDPLASAVLITDDAPMAEAVRDALVRQVVQLARREIAEQSLKAFGALVVVEDLSTAVALANRIAPEHLELQVRDPFALVGDIRHAGAVFMGTHTPEAVGDYVAGPNHVLPTAGTARFSSALSVNHFLKQTSLLHYTAEAFRREAADIIHLARIEGLEGHARSVEVRLGRTRK
ncbi:histidinol dehydrogenase [Desulfatitalea alkaliphila]|uniref:Histidinol dehydrogenase n=1 Tax=Desulfatitalea alkaliphila TaxID=2929485 RepID=A0AA41R0I9_9BACT|nr:histidinol dehydrogenase [Desulfatitalea alkaliphila]MCJ8499882.1 histidinol dehydrogenase [Desulfatitalea alkaliphila]